MCKIRSFFFYFILYYSFPAFGQVVANNNEIVFKGINSDFSKIISIGAERDNLLRKSGIAVTKGINVEPNLELSISGLDEITNSSIGKRYMSLTSDYFYHFNRILQDQENIKPREERRSGKPDICISAMCCNPGSCGINYAASQETAPVDKNNHDVEYKVIKAVNKTAADHIREYKEKEERLKKELEDYEKSKKK